MTVTEYENTMKTISGDMWKVFKAHITTENQPDEWWDKLHEEFTAVWKRYHGTPFDDYCFAMYDLYTKEIGKLIKGGYE